MLHNIYFGELVKEVEENSASLEQNKEKKIKIPTIDMNIFFSISLEGT